jgi:hypothetical protein
MTIADLMRGLCLLLSNLSPEVQIIYVETLEKEKLTSAQLEYAYNEALRRCDKMPKPAEIIRLANEMPVPSRYYTPLEAPVLTEEQSSMMRDSAHEMAKLLADNPPPEEFNKRLEAIKVRYNIG